MTFLVSISVRTIIEENSIAYTISVRTIIKENSIAYTMAKKNYADWTFVVELLIYKSGQNYTK